MSLDLSQVHTKPIPVDVKDFQQIIEGANIPIIIDAWAEWCGPCKQIAPVYEKLAEEYAGKALFLKVNVDEEQIIAQNLSISSIPTFFWLNKNEIRDRVVGANRSALEKMIKKAIKEEE